MSGFPEFRVSLLWALHHEVRDAISNYPHSHEKNDRLQLFLVDRLSLSLFAIITPKSQVWVIAAHH